MTTKGIYFNGKWYADAEFTSGVLKIANGGTGASTAATARTNLGLNDLSSMKVLMGSVTSTGGFYDTDGISRWTAEQTVTFSSSFSSAPLVFTQATANNLEANSCVRSKSAKGFAWDAVEVIAETDTSHNVTIDWIAIGI